jgi:D-cysteine desulfhydrase family pyridoxal phosphate-dependent enzyme
MQLAQALEKYAREDLTRTPTPLEFLPNLSAQLELEIYIKRDDLTDLALGGDKPRKLEYELAHARSLGADTLVTCGSTQSNHARLTVAAARKLGLDCAVVLSDSDWNLFQGNLLTVYLMGARVEVHQTEDHWDLEKHAHALCDELRAEGKSPHYIPVSGTTPLSCLGYVRCAIEIVKQVEALNLSMDHIYSPFGTGGIATAILLTLRTLGIQTPVAAISVNRDRQVCEENLEKLWADISSLLDCELASRPTDYELFDAYVGLGYGDPTEACLDAIMLMAQSEGILLDPVYSGKMFGGFLGHQKEGKLQKGEKILLIHSGGVPALFAYHDVLRDHLKKRGIDIELKTPK